MTHRTVASNGISMHVIEQGTGPLVVLCHGFPELAHAWRHQISALAEAGYRAVAPDQRGYGGSDRPADVASYDVVHLCEDLLGLLDSMGEERAVFVGHDWGAAVVWQLSTYAPERVRAVVGMSVPFIPRAPVPPVAILDALAGDAFMYIVYFQQVGPADVELAADPRRTLLRVLWSMSGDAPSGSMRRLPRAGTGFLDAMSDPLGIPSWLTEADLDLLVSEFARTGFTGGLNWYRNLDKNWEITEGLARAKVTQPAMFVAGERDRILRMTPPEIMDGWVEDLRGSIIVPGAGHWIQQERPDEVNAALLGFLASMD
jgi:pimeloyl-ACP methyl ester carboxylesterase